MFPLDFKPIDLTEFVLRSELKDVQIESGQEFLNSKFIGALTLWSTNPEEAYSCARDFEAMVPQSKLLEVMLLIDGMKNVRSKLLHDRIIALESSITLVVEKEILRIPKASVLFEMFRYSECIIESERVLKFFPTAVEFNLLIAQAYAIEEQHKKAIPYYKKVIDSDAFGKIAIANMAYSYLVLKRTLKSLIWHKKIVDEFPMNYKIQYNMALCYSRFRFFRKAIKFLNRAEELEKNWDGIYATRGSIYKIIGKQNLAIQDLEKARSLGNQAAEKLLRRI